MKKVTNILFALMLTVAMGACAQRYSGTFFGSGTRVEGSNNYVTKQMRVDDFTKVNLAGAVDVAYTQQPGRAGVEIYAPDNIVELLDIKVERGTLSIGFKKGYSVSYKKLEIRIHSEQLAAIGLSGSGTVDLGNKLECAELKVSLAGSGDVLGNNIRCNGPFTVALSGSGDVNLSRVSCGELSTSIAGSGDVDIKEIAASQVNASIAGSGDITLAGQTERASYSVAGSGDIHATGLRAAQVDASTAGSGDIECYASELLKTKVSGSGGIGYKGDPQVQSSQKPRGVYKL